VRARVCVYVEALDHLSTAIALMPVITWKFWL
jgi:hypothetical protein